MANIRDDSCFIYGHSCGSQMFQGNCILVMMSKNIDKKIAMISQYHKLDLANAHDPRIQYAFRVKHLKLK